MGNGGIYDNDVNMTSKKRRVSNYVRPPDMATNSSGVGGGSPLSTLSANGKSPMRRSPSAFSGSGGTNGSSGSGSNTSLSNNKPGWSPNRHKSKVASSTSPDYYQQQQQQQQQQQPSQHHRSHQSPFGRGGNQDNTDGGNISSEHHSQQQQQQHHNTESAADEVEQQQPQPQRRVVNKYDSQDYMNQFTTISSKEQRVRYKAEFNSNYNEYRELHSLLHEVSRKFAVLEDQLKREQPGSEEWKVK